MDTAAEPSGFMALQTLPEPYWQHQRGVLATSRRT